MGRLQSSVVVGALAVIAAACGGTNDRGAATPAIPPEGDVSSRLGKYTTVRLDADLGSLTEAERRMIPLLIDAARIMDELFWRQAFGDRDALLASIADPAARRYAEINYGPWDRLAGNEPFLPGFGPKPKGAGFYPQDLTKEEFESAAARAADGGAALRGTYTIVERDGADLRARPYHDAFRDRLTVAAGKLRDAAMLAEDPGLARYLELRAEALLDDDYRGSDLAWLDMKNNGVDMVIGPIETYEDALFGYKAAYEAYVLLKDRAWSARLEKFAAFLPELQRGLPVEAVYRAELPGTDSDLNAYDVVYYAGDCNAGSKTIAINLPNDEQVQLLKGTRRLQLKNAMQAKFDGILLPVADAMIAPDQRPRIRFDRFFENVMFHEVAHGLGIKNTVSGRGSVRDVLRDRHSTLEEAKADVLGLYMVSKLRERGELTEGEMADNYVTFLAGIFRSVRFGAASAHGRANLLQFRFLNERGAFLRDAATGTYRVDLQRIPVAVEELARTILTVQGDGDYAAAGALVPEDLDPTLRQDLDALGKRGIPVDVVFEQGMDVLSAAR